MYDMVVLSWLINSTFVRAGVRRMRPLDAPPEVKVRYLDRAV
jgi:hypothetical protein